MKREWKRIMGAALMLAALLAGTAAARAEETTAIEIFVSAGAMEQETVLRLCALAQETYPQAAWRVTFEEDAGVSLRERVLADRAPQVVLCAPQEALVWAGEGLLTPLEGRVSGLSRMAQEVVDACVTDETLYVAPLLARHRRVAVNADLLIARGLGYLLDERAHPVWMPSELYQAMEESTLAGVPAMELWLPQADDAAAIEAFVQALYGGRVAEPDGEGMLVAMTWLRDLAQSGWITLVADRQTALAHFVAGQTLLFIDWSDAEEERFAQRMIDGGINWDAVPYPSVNGRPVRSFELTGAAVFAGDDAQAVSLARQAVSLWSEEDRAALGERGVWQDGAVWLPQPSAGEGGGTLRGLFAGAVREMLAGSQSPEGALRQLREVIRAVSGE